MLCLEEKKAVIYVERGVEGKRCSSCFCVLTEESSFLCLDVSIFVFRKMGEKSWRVFQLDGFEEGLHHKKKEDGGHVVALVNSRGVVNLSGFRSYFDFNLAIVV